MVDEALALWRGQPFAGVPGPFAEAERLRLTELRTTAAEERADLLLAQGQAAAAVPELTTLVAEHPLRERARGLLMIALYRCGRQAEALRVFHDARERLAEDLGIDPGTELARIHQRVLAMDPALDMPAEAPAAEPVSLPLLRPGLSRRLPRPPRRAGRPRRRPPAAPAGPRRARPSCRPSPPASSAGRSSSTGCTRCCPGRPPSPARCPQASSVALITGTAGVGKTTLAIRFARQAGPLFPDGQLYVNLRGFDPASAPMQPGTALQWFFDALGVPAMNVPSALEAQSALLRTLLDGKRMLLLLDNAHDADQVRPLLPGSPGCMVLVTSRSQLTGLVVEGARPVPLDVLDAREAAELVARRLGAERAAGRVGGGGGDRRALRGAAARAQRDLRPGGRPAGAAARRPRRRARRRARPARRAADRRGDHRPARGLLLVGRQAQRPGRADVPAARPAPRARHIGRRGGLARGGHAGRGADRAGRADQGLAADRGRGRPVRLP